MARSRIGKALLAEGFDRQLGDGDEYPEEVTGHVSQMANRLLGELSVKKVHLNGSKVALETTNNGLIIEVKQDMTPSLFTPCRQIASDPVLVKLVEALRRQGCKGAPVLCGMTSGRRAAAVVVNNESTLVVSVVS